MINECIATGRTVDEAIETACRELGVEREAVTFEILELNKKTMLGLKIIPARVKVTIPVDKGTVAEDYLGSVLREMGLGSVTITTTKTDDNIVMALDGEGLGVVIGRRGETLDALQYLTSLVANRMDGPYLRISIDIGDYRQKREETLVALAKKLANQAIKNGRSVTLEPMNPYERRVIHSSVQEIEGATSRSIGEEPTRRVVISSISAKRPSKSPERQSERGERSDRGERSGGDRGGRDRRRGGDSRGRGGRDRDRQRAPQPAQTTRPAEVKEEAKDKPLYGKIDLSQFE